MPAKRTKKPQSVSPASRVVRNAPVAQQRAYVSRATRRKHLDERLMALNERVRMIEAELKRLEDRFYRVCIFGSARIKPDTKTYRDVKELARYLAQLGIDILTGGGPGLMEAANQGAQEGRKEKQSKSLSFGLSIQLPHEALPNPHLDVKRHHQKFSSRLDDFIRLSNSVVVTPGGIGTVLEFMFVWQLIQVKHIPPRPIILMDRKFWAGFLEWMKGLPLERRLLNKDDFDVIKVVDTPEEVCELLKPHYQEFLKQKPMLDKLSKEF